MGKCFSNNNKIIFKRDFVPQDSHQYHQHRLASPISNSKEFQQYSSLISKKSGVYVEVTAKQLFNFKTHLKKDHPIVKVPNFYQWKIQQIFDIELNEWGIRNTFLKFEIKDKEQKILGTVQFNLYNIAINPFHHDFSIQFENFDPGRISFDCKISQFLKIQISPLKMSVSLQKNQRKQSYDYQLKFIVKISNQNQVQNYFSKFSESIANPIENSLLSNQKKEEEVKQRSKQQNVKEKGLQRKNSQKVSKKILLQWKYDLKQQNPKLTFPILSSDMNITAIQILIWGKMLDQHQLVGECYLSLNKLTFQTQMQIVIQINKINKVQERQTNILNSQLEREGIFIGEGEFQFVIKNTPFIKQPIVGVRTENGVQKASSLFDKQHIKKGGIAEIKQLQIYKQKFQEAIVSMQRSKLNYNQNVRQFWKNFEAINKLIKVTKKQSTLCFIYNNQDELLKGQMIVLNLAFVLFRIQESTESQRINQFCYDTLQTLIKRGELDLKYFSFLEDQKKILQTCSQQQIKKNHNFLYKKLEVGLKYQQLLVIMLKDSLNKLILKAQGKNQRKFVQTFCAIAYFKLPKFRQKLLESLKRQTDPQIVEWRGTQYSLEKKLKPGQLFHYFFDWQQAFHKPMQKFAKAKQSIQFLQIILNDSKWQQRLSKRGLVYNFFIIFWIDYIKQTVIVFNKQMSWQQIPGYRIILKSFLAQAKSTPIRAYKDSFVKAAAKMLANQKLLNVFISIFFNKTRIYDSATVIKVIDIIGSFLEGFNKQHKKIPMTFNYQFLLIGVKRIFQAEDCYCISKAILLIYKYYDLLHLDFRRLFTFFLLGTKFFKIFLHWSPNVRLAFHYFLIFRIFHNSVNKTVERMSQESKLYGSQIKTIHLHVALIYKNQQILQKYRTLMMQLQNNLQSEDYFKFNKQKDLYKRMRKKLIFKKNKSKRNKNHEMLPSNHKFADYKINNTQRSMSECFQVKLIEQIKRKRQQSDQIQPVSRRKQSYSQQSGKVSVDLQQIQNHLQFDRRHKEQNLSNQVPQIEECNRTYLKISSNQFDIIMLSYKKTYEISVQNNREIQVPVVQINIPNYQYQDTLQDQW